MNFRRSGFGFTIAILSIALASCSNGSLGTSLQRSLGADPRLAENATQVGVAVPDGTESCAPNTLANLPEEFPAALCYPDGDLVTVSSPGTDAPEANESDAADSEASGDGLSGAIATEWETQNSAEQVQAFYRQRLEANDWEITTPSSTAGDAGEAGIEAVKAGNQVRVSFLNASSVTVDPDAAPDADTATAQTAFTVEFQLQRQTVAGGAALTEEAARLFSQVDPSESDRTETGDRSPAGATVRSATTTDRPAARAGSFTDLDEAPQELLPYIEDLNQLGVLTPPNSTSAQNRSNNTASSSASAFAPNATISRRDFARWLFETNNAIYGDRPSRRIRAASPSGQAVFRDVPPSDPDFEMIQGLAESGLIPSSLSGASTEVNFRPDAPLTRETLIAWKVPLDVRGNLPTATVDAVQQTWGFQDANRINPNALRAVLSDYQNGDNANILRAFGYTTLFQPQKAVTRAEAAAALWYFGYQGDGLSAQDALSSGSDSANADESDN